MIECIKWNLVFKPKHIIGPSNKIRRKKSYMEQDFKQGFCFVPSYYPRYSHPHAEPDKRQFLSCISRFSYYNSE